MSCVEIDMQRLNHEILKSGEVEMMVRALTLESSVSDEIKESQIGDKKLDRIKDNI